VIDFLADTFKRSRGDRARPGGDARLQEAAERANRVVLGPSRRPHLPHHGRSDGTEAPPTSSCPLPSSGRWSKTWCRNIDPCKRRSRRGLSTSQICDVILVGGQTPHAEGAGGCARVLRQGAAQDSTRTKRSRLGAVHQGVLGAGQGRLLLDVTPLSLGIETLGGVMTRLIERKQTDPDQTSAGVSTGTTARRQSRCTSCRRREPAVDNKSLGRFDLSTSRRHPEAWPQIEVTFDIDANGILHVSAKDKATGKEHRSASPRRPAVRTGNRPNGEGGRRPIG